MTLKEKFRNYKIILASQSPRRQQLLGQLNLNFEVKPVDVEETYPEALKQKEIAIYLSELKARAFDFETNPPNCLVITADTVVWMDQQSFEKPKDANDARRMLSKLSGNKHEVITGVTLRSIDKLNSFYCITNVYFKQLSTEEIDFYIENFKPFDKAGAYGVQEWIGSVGIERIEGSYLNVVGLPVHMVYKELLRFI